MSYAHIGAVTGANKGIGLAIVRQLVLQYPKSPLNNGPLLIYLTARDKGRGEAAMKSLYEDAQLQRAGALRKDGGLTDITFHQLDISDSVSIKDFSGFLRKEHEGGVDFVVNNAGIAMEGFDNNVVKETLGCNYYGSLEASLDFLPLIKPTGRLVNVSSMAGKLNKYSDSIRARFLSAKSIEDITTLMEDFTSAVKAGNEREEGWPSAAYAVSKAGMTGMTKAIAREEQSQGGKRLINACCPGWVNTDMTKHRGSRTPDRGAQTPVMLAIEDIGGTTGEFWQSEKVVEW